MGNDKSEPDWENEHGLNSASGEMLRDFIMALKDCPFKRIVLQTGAKVRCVSEKRQTPSTNCFTALRSTYWTGKDTLPGERSSSPHDLISIMSEQIHPKLFHSRLTHTRQEDIPKELSPKQNFTYSVTRPSYIIVAVKGIFMNLACVFQSSIDFSQLIPCRIHLGLYFMIEKELGRPVVFPGSLTSLLQRAKQKCSWHIRGREWIQVERNWYILRCYDEQLFCRILRVEPSMCWQGKIKTS